jgi:hypothetical protein
MARQAAPPSELVFGTSGTYGELAKKIPRTVSRVAETASYNNKGQFLYKEISIPPYTYFFSSVEIVPEEMTCLIKIRLKNT